MKKRKDRSVTEGALPSLGEVLEAFFPPVPPGEEALSEALPMSPAAPEGESLPARALIRRSRKGRAGHTVTLVELPGLSRSARADLAKAMARALGCGSRLEEDRVVLQGDQMERAEAWLSGRGVVRVVRGN